MTCKVDKLIAFDCEAIQQGGVEDYTVLLNQDAWKNATVTIDGVTGEIVTIILTQQGDAGYKWQTPKGAANNMPTHTLRVVDGADGYDHSHELRLQTIEQLDTDNIAKIRFNKILTITPLVDGRFILAGGYVDATPSPVGVGMRLSEDDSNISDASVGGSQHFIAKTPDGDPPEMKKPMLIASSFDIDALLVPIP